MPTAEVMWPRMDWGLLCERWDDALPIFLALLFVCIFDTAGVQFGAGMQAGLLVDGELPGAKAAFLGASVATMVGAVMGTSPVIIHNETCAGIAEGGRTGLTALVVAAYFCVSVFFIPVFSAVPITATAPALIIVGAFMMGPAGDMDWNNFKESLPAYLTIALMPLTFSIANGVVAGLAAYAVLEVFTSPLLVNAVKGICGTNSPKNGLSEPLTTSAMGADKRISSAASSPHAMLRVPSLGEAVWGGTNGVSAAVVSPSAGRTYRVP